MHPRIENSAFGWLSIGGQKYKHDVVINHTGEIRKRNKKLSKAEYGTSHIISLPEACDVYIEGMTGLLIGSGMFDSVRLSEAAADYFQRKSVVVKILPTKKAIIYWNDSDALSVGLFHVTC